MMGLAEYTLSLLSLFLFCLSFVIFSFDHEQGVFLMLAAIVLALYAILFRPDHRKDER